MAGLMKKRINVFMLLLAVFIPFLLASCGPNKEDITCLTNNWDESTLSDPFRNFWIIDFTKDYTNDPCAWYTIKAQKLSNQPSLNAIVYVDVKQTQITSAIADDLATAFTNEIYNNVTANFASPYDVDNNGKTILLVYDVRDDNYYNRSLGTYVGGYFFQIDLYSAADVANMNPIMHTNQADMLHIDCKPQSLTGTTAVDAKRTMAHEFQHLVNYSNYLQNKMSGNETVSWIDEGFSEAANHLCYGEVTDRINYYNTYSGDINQHPLFYWDENNSLANYSKSYLFFQYLRGQSSSGWSIFKAIIQSQYGDYRAVQNASLADSTLGTWDTSPVDKVDKIFNKILLRWYGANNGVFGLNYSYPSDVTKPNPVPYTGSYVSLKSGGGVVKSTNASTYTANRTGYIYLGVNSSGTSEDFDGPIYTTYAPGKFIAVYKNGCSTDGGTGSTPMPVVNADMLSDEESAANTVRKKSMQPDKPMMIDPVFPKDLMHTPRNQNKPD
jgi:hypothetical protein